MNHLPRICLQCRELGITVSKVLRCGTRNNKNMQFRTCSLKQLKTQENKILVLDESTGTTQATSEEQKKWHFITSLWKIQAYSELQDKDRMQTAYYYVLASNVTVISRTACWRFVYLPLPCPRYNYSQLCTTKTRDSIFYFCVLNPGLLFVSWRELNCSWTVCTFPFIPSRPTEYRTPSWIFPLFVAAVSCLQDSCIAIDYPSSVGCCGYDCCGTVVW
jgi:hypothetical protein